MGSIISIDKPPEEPPPLDVPTEPEHQEATAAGLWQRMMEHAISMLMAQGHDGDVHRVGLNASANTSQLR